MLVEPTKKEFLKIVHDFIQKHHKEYKNFIEGVAG